MKIARGDTDAGHELWRMASEKVDAAVEAGMTLMCGGSPIAVIDRYREHVAVNSERLSGAPSRRGWPGFDAGILAQASPLRLHFATKQKWHATVR